MTPSPRDAARPGDAARPEEIVYATFSDAYDIEDAREQRKTLYWLTVLVNRVFYTTSMNVLRSIYLPLGLISVQRETPILDLFIALKVRDNVWADDSDLHLSRAESTFADLFSLMQPRARIEDLVRGYGVAHGVVYIDRRRGGADKGPTSVVLRSDAPYAALTQRLASSARSSGSSFWHSFSGKGKAPTPPTPRPSQKVTVRPLPFSALSVSFSVHRVGLVLTTGGGASKSKRTIVEAARTREEALEVAARRLVWGLRDWLVDGVDGL
ncbi:hypothetical protein B0H14DRAFT_2584239 [Mycena olivaceomarginata]|nr:hypothetical protein B0H14DRAFT_2584239 [Mycena olivaceomarginata]